MQLEKILFMHESMKERLHYVDVTRGVLMLIVIVHHCFWVMSTYFIPYNLFFINGVFKYRFSYIIWFMSAFFILSGYCSSFGKDNKQFIIKNAKHLLVPQVTLLPIIFYLYGALDWKTILIHWNGIWFLQALFFSRVIYNFFRTKCSNMFVCVLLCFAVSLVGMFWNQRLPQYNIWNCIQGLVMIPFLAFGEILRKRALSKGELMGCYVFFGAWLIYKLIDISGTIGVTGIVWNVTPLGYVLLFVVSVPATVVIMDICKRINENKYLEKIGKASLIIYMIHTLLLVAFGDHFPAMLANTPYALQPLLLVVVFVVATLLAWICSALIDTKYLRWILGKF